MVMSLELLEYPACPLCGLNQPKPESPYQFSPYQVVECGGCGLWYLSPRLKEAEILKIYANSDYFKGGGAHGYAQTQGSYLEQATGLRLTFRQLLKKIRQQGLLGEDLLEIGCGYGFLLAEAKPFCQRLSATDFDAEAVARVRETGVTVYLGGVDALPEGQQFDTVISTGVIEHIYNPHEFLQRLKPHLKPNAWVILAAPPMNSFWLKLQGKNWASFKIPEHVVYYDKNTLKQLFVMNGAVETRYIPYSQAYPLGMIAEKLGVVVPRWVQGWNIWLPATMFAMAGRFTT
ncbi:methyltransferase family protein [Beggiatoa alba B18LD]|uniref:Methyltransferase family protein n=1 Tax=Beggiatoa alba B18LD TaxID=395493 RepID=I3CC44_9GAMM|nr:class I SAM-dependent methyltransferase [Beggiatoa alba]EIJ41187.1 methyltransferase family protein [Beggiatoa alba B18LD]